MTETTRAATRGVLLIDSDPWRAESLRRFLVEHRFRVETVLREPVGVSRHNP